MTTSLEHDFETELLERAERYGVLPSYLDVFDREHRASAATVRAIVRAMGLDVSSDAALVADLDARLDRPWTRRLEPVTFALGGAATVAIAAPAAARAGLCSWRLELESGGHRSGAFTLATRPLLDSRTIEGVAYERFGLALDALPLGYHRLTVTLAGQSTAATVIAAPPACHLPDRIAEGGRLWGLAVQLYALHSQRDAGIGDFTDLRDVVAAVAAAGGALVGVSPLHDVDVTPGRTPSPYSPRSRLDMSALYIDVDALPGFDPADVPGEMRAAAKASTFVDYGAVAAYKQRAIDAAFARFRTGGGAAQARAFAHFVDAGGAVLRRGAIFAALAERFAGEGLGTSWQDWPAAYRDPASPEVAAFAHEAAPAVERALYIQWQADVQLAAAARAGAAMPIGVYRDVAVGAAGGGAETWALGEAMLGDVRVGAPPDLLNRAGQNWGVAPFDPAALRETAYRPFAELVRANMRHAGAIRIDHVMALARLWWVPRDADPADGCYVSYRLDEMLAIVALESVRARCLVIGEDLGTVPAGFREKLAEKRVLSYRLLGFEVDAQGRHVPPHEYPVLALVSSSTHDLAPIAAHVAAHDIGVRQEIGLYDAAAAEQARAERATANERLFEALSAAGIAAGTLDRLRGKKLYDKRDRERVVDAVTAFLAQTPSAILMLPLEDVLGELEQPNVPTTIDEHPNWRRRTSVPVDAIVKHRRLSALAALLRERDARRPAQN